MSRRKSISRIGVRVVFVGLLISSVLLSNQKIYHLSNGGEPDKKKAQEKYGFYLEPVTEEAGINFVHTPPALDPKLKHIERQIASMGASVSICDFDNDGWNDIYFTNSSPGSKNALYHNLHNGKFEDIADRVGLAYVNQPGTGVSMGAIWGDYDNDGYEDLLLYKWGRPELYHNVGGKKFERVTEGSGLPQWINANSAIWLDFDNDGLLDLFIGGYYKEDYD